MPGNLTESLPCRHYSSVVRHSGSLGSILPWPPRPRCLNRRSSTKSSCSRKMIRLLLPSTIEVGKSTIDFDTHEGSWATCQIELTMPPEEFEALLKRQAYTHSKCASGRNGTENRPRSIVEGTVDQHDAHGGLRTKLRAVPRATLIPILPAAISELPWLARGSRDREARATGCCTNPRG